MPAPLVGGPRGVSRAPESADDLAGRYYRGDGTGYNVYLRMNEDGTYAAEWQGCLGKYGDASGKWRLTGKRVVFAPSQETGMMKGHLKELDVLQFADKWILVPTEDNVFYRKWGVSRHSCFQRTERE